MKNCRDSSLSLRGLEARLPAFQLPMFAKCDALKEICSTCLSNAFRLQKIPSLWRRFRICVSFREAKVWSVLLQGLLWNIGMCFFFHLPCRLLQCVEIELLGSVGRKCGCQPFSYPCTLCGTHCRKRFCSTCLFQEFRPFVKSKPPLPTS